VRSGAEASGEFVKSKASSANLLTAVSDHEHQQQFPAVMDLVVETATYEVM